MTAAKILRKERHSKFPQVEAGLLKKKILKILFLQEICQEKVPFFTGIKNTQNRKSVFKNIHKTWERRSSTRSK